MESKFIAHEFKLELEPRNWYRGRAILDIFYFIAWIFAFLLSLIILHASERGYYHDMFVLSEKLRLLEKNKNRFWRCLAGLAAITLPETLNFV